MLQPRVRASETLKQKRSVLEHRISSADDINLRKDKYFEAYQVYQTKLNHLLQYEDSINRIYKGSMAKAKNYHDECIENLESRLEAVLGVLFPTEDFRAKITYTTVRNKDVAEVRIGKYSAVGPIKWGKPKARDGGFMKQLISFSMLISVNLLLGSHVVMFDEPFSSSDEFNITQLVPIFEMLLDEGVQLILIEHKPEMYQQIPRNEILLLKHRSPLAEHDGFVEVLSCERVEPENDNQYTGLDEGSDNIQPE